MSCAATKDSNAIIIIIIELICLNMISPSFDYLRREGLVYKVYCWGVLRKVRFDFFSLFLLISN